MTGNRVNFVVVCCIAYVNIIFTVPISETASSPLYTLRNDANQYTSPLMMTGGCPGGSCSPYYEITRSSNHKPVFTECSSYAPVIKEEMEAGTFIIQVHAEDEDPPDEGGTIIYELTTSDEANLKFEIDNKTGIIKTKRVLDRDEPMHEKKEYISVLATGNGKVHPLEEICQFKVTIEDVNDNPPLFEKTVYNELVPQDTLIGKEVMRVSATDIDDGENSIVSYKLSAKNAEENDYFRIDEKSGIILLNKIIDKKVGYKFNLIAMAEDIHGSERYGTKPKFSTVDLSIRVIQRHTKPPILTADKEIVRLPEDFNNYSASIVRLTAQSSIKDKPDLTFQLNVGMTEQTSSQNTFKLVVVNTTTADIKLALPLDYETISEYLLIARVNNSYGSAAEMVIKIEVEDVNDNYPMFSRTIFTGNSIREDANVNASVTTVEATDKDAGSGITYSIISGNTEDRFFIEPSTGIIRVKNPLDYKKMTEYYLKVMASDGTFNDTAVVRIFVENVNDNIPIFMDLNANLTVREESLPSGCITTVKAYDPDVEDIDADQKIVYSIAKDEQKQFISIDKNGCMKIIQPLDRDPPNGHPMWPVVVLAQDNDGLPKSLEASTTININLIDINDNAPFLDMPYPVVWNENQAPGKITKLFANDYDTPEKGPPFQFHIDPNADDDIRKKFWIKDDNLYALVSFDREERKSYDVPIAISDSGNPQMTGISILKVTIGDVNDNAMKPGESSIFVYNYKGKSPKVEIGRVHVDDPDDWDLPDKNFSWASESDGFDLDLATGMLTMLPGKSDGFFRLKFFVTEESRIIPRHSVHAYVNVTVKCLPEEAVKSSGSVRFLGISSEDFVMSNERGISKKDIFQKKLATLLNKPLENVDVFTVLHSPHHNESFLDVRFSAHGSPYYAPEKLNTIMAQNVETLEREIAADIYMLNIDECMVERENCLQEGLCSSILNISEVSSSVFTNRTSFVGVRAIVDPECSCQVRMPLGCLNGGTQVAERCECSTGYEGPHCEKLNIEFRGKGWAILPPPGHVCVESTIELEVTPATDGLVFYFGPMVYNSKLAIHDFMALEVKDGYALLSSNFGSGTVNLEQKQIRLTDGESHKIYIMWSNASIQMQVDECTLSTCLAMTNLTGTNTFLNVNSPLQIGGTLSNLSSLSSKFNWGFTPTSKGFVGCIKNITFNGNVYDVGMPGMSLDATLGCKDETIFVIKLVLGANFWVAFLTCMIIFVLLFCFIMVYDKKFEYILKDTDDVRESMMNNDDDRGGEDDIHPDSQQKLLEKLLPSDQKMLDDDLPKQVPGCPSFPDKKKKKADQGLATNLDDVRNYNYEGSQDSEGSLSSLASCADDKNLDLYDASSFGPKFQKLAEMFDENP